MAGEYRSRTVGQGPVASAILRPRRNWTRGVAAQHASLSRWRSPVRIRSGPPSPAFPYAPSARPDGAFLCPALGGRRRSPEPPLARIAARETPPPARRRSACSRWPSPCRSPAASSGSAEPVARLAGRDRTAPPRRDGADRRRRRSRRDRRRHSATPTAEPPPTAGRPRRPVAATCRDRAGHPVPRDRGPRPTATEVAAVLAGTSERYEALELVEADADAILAALGAGAPRRRRAGSSSANDAATLTTDLAEAPQAPRVPARRRRSRPAVRALAWGGRALFGVDRVTDARRLAAARAALAAAPADDAFDPAATWTLFAGGDILLDRGVYETIRVKGKGVDFPFDGGTAEITGLHVLLALRLGRCRTRSGPATRARCASLIKGADLAIANFENPAPNRFRWHTQRHGLLGRPGAHRRPRQRRHRLRLRSPTTTSATRAAPASSRRSRTSRSAASRYSGAGKDAGGGARRRRCSRPAARRSRSSPTTRSPALPRRRGRRAGSAALIAQARARPTSRRRARPAPTSSSSSRTGAREYDYDAVRRASSELAHDIIDAGADMIIGNHAHWAAAMEVYEGKPIWYALGNFVFDQTWSEPTMEGITLELTFHGAELVQVRMRPHIILDKAQPNFLDPAGDGKVVMGQVYDASKGLLPW